MEYAAFAAVALAFVIFALVVFAVGVAWLVRFARPKATATAVQPAAMRPVVAEPLRPFTPSPAPAPDIVDLVIDHRNRRNAENERRNVSEAIDGIAFWANKLPGAAAPAAATVPSAAEPSPNP